MRSSTQRSHPRGIMRAPARHCETSPGASGTVERTSLLESVVDSAQDAIISTTLEGVITSWNRAAETIYGYSTQEAIGQRISILASWERPNQMLDNLAKVRSGERIEHHEVLGVRKDGSRRRVSLSVSPICDVAGAIVGASTIGRDITERRRAEGEAPSVSQDPR